MVANSLNNVSKSSVYRWLPSKKGRPDIEFPIVGDKLIKLCWYDLFGKDINYVLLQLTIFTPTPVAILRFKGFYKVCVVLVVIKGMLACALVKWYSILFEQIYQRPNFEYYCLV